MAAVPVVFITGAAGGVGRAIAGRFAADGYAVALTGRAQAPLDELARALAPAQTAIVLCDVTDAGQVQRAVADAEQRLGPIDVLVNNAGAADSAPFASMDDGLWERMLAANLTGTYHVMRAVIPGMFGRGRGRVINIASSAGKRGFAYTAAYVAAKHGVLGLTRAVAIEAAAHGVTVNAICPGWIDTPMTDASIARIVEKTGRSPAEARRTLERMNPQGRLIQPGEVVALAALLASPDAQWINGQAIDL
jgi:NAD(P)-dependent dehydrogenase (short-subunit alcohol dehydrogenase family)